MRFLPMADKALLVRTDFADQAAWEAICKSIREPADDFPFVDQLEILEDSDLDGLTKDQLLGLVPEGSTHTFIIIADRTSHSPPEYPLLVVDLSEEPGREFRATASHIQGVDANLSISNMDFEDFTAAVDEDGIFRGFH